MIIKERLLSGSRVEVVSVMENGQISLEYLIVFSIGLSVLLGILPILSRVRSLSEESVRSAQVDSIARDVSIACDEVLTTGGSVSIDMNPGIKVEDKGGKVNISYGDFSTDLEINENCDLSFEEDKLFVRLSRGF